jgi:hypothetical protein
LAGAYLTSYHTHYQVLLPAKIGTAINASPFSTKLLTFVRLAGLE